MEQRKNPARKARDQTQQRIDEKNAEKVPKKRTNNEDDSVVMPSKPKASKTQKNEQPAKTKLSAKSKDLQQKQSNTDAENEVPAQKQIVLVKKFPRVKQKEAEPRTEPQYSNAETNAEDSIPKKKATAKGKRIAPAREDNENKPSKNPVTGRGQKTKQPTKSFEAHSGDVQQDESESETQAPESILKKRVPKKMAVRAKMAKPAKTPTTTESEDHQSDSDSKAASSDKKKHLYSTNENDNEESPKAKSSKSNNKKASDNSNGEQPSPSKGFLNDITTNYSDLDFTIKKHFNFKIAFWNVAGIRALLKKGGKEYFENENADVICMVELKCSSEDFPKDLKLKGYHDYLNIAKGSPGVAVFCKNKPLKITYDLQGDEFKNEKRLITVEFPDFFLVATYVVNAGRQLKTMDKRMEWNKEFDNYIQSLDKEKPVIIAGDMNVAHKEIDLANPATNQKNAGFTPQEREGFTKLLSLGFIDTFRHFYPEKKDAYTFWSYMGSARKKNVGWRLDYFLCSNRITNKLKDVVIRSEVLGSDHCPIVLFMEI